MNPIDSNRIGIVIWGCKGGKTTFCDNGIVDIKRTDIANTLKDIRSFIRIHRIRIDYYALEFTNEYKVYTIYRSSTDSGSGAYIAITVYVPHDMKVKHMREILKEMMDGFFRSYVNALSGSPLAEGFYDIGKFTFVLRQQHQQDIVADVTRYMKRASLQDDKPCVWVYNEDSEVDKFFDMPYYPRFYDCQEVMFISREIWDNQEQYEVDLVFTPEIITDPGRPEGEGRLMRFNLPGFTLAALLINGKAMNVNDEEIVVNLGDEIECTITHPYYKDWTYGKANKANLEQALEHKVLKRSSDNIYHWNTSGIATVMKNSPKEFFLPLSLQGEGFKAKDVVQQLKLSDGSKDLIPVTERDGQRGFVIKGENWDGTSHSLRLYPYTADTQHYLDVESAINPIEKTKNNGLNLMLQGRKYQLTQGSAQPNTVNVTISYGEKGSKRCKLQIKSSDMELVIPTNAMVEFEANDCDCLVQGDDLTFVPAIATPHTTGTPNKAHDAEETQQPSYRDAGIRQEENLPSHEETEGRQTPQERKPTTYTVIVINCDYFISRSKYRWERIDEKTCKTTVDSPEFFLSSTKSSTKSEVICKVDMNNPLRFQERNKRNGFTVTINGNECIIVYAFYVIDVVNCERFIKAEKEQWTEVRNEENTSQRKTLSSYFELKDAKGNPVCRVEMSQPGSFNDDNRKNGFTVTITNTPNGTTYCRVVYEPSIFKRLGKRLMMACGLLSLLLVAGLGFWAYKHWSKPSFEVQKYNEISALFVQMGKDAVPDTAKLMALIDSCAIYGINENGEYTGNNDDFNDLAHEVVQKLKEDPRNRAAALYLLYMGKKEQAVSPGINISALYKHTDKPAFEDQKYVEEIWGFTQSSVDTTDVNEGNEVSEIATQNNDADAGAQDKKNAEDQQNAGTNKQNNKQNQTNQQVQKFKQLYNGLGELKQITTGNIGKVRKAYNNLPPGEKKPEYDKKIKAYEALVNQNTNSETRIQEVLNKHPDAFSKKQKDALKKVESPMHYQIAIQNKGYIDINYINETIKK